MYALESCSVKPRKPYALLRRSNMFIDLNTIKHGVPQERNAGPGIRL
jgi:hypothetical protein